MQNPGSSIEERCWQKPPPLSPKSQQSQISILRRDLWDLGLRSSGFGHEVQPGEVVVYRDRPWLELIPLVSGCNKISLTRWYTDEPVITEWVRHRPDHVARMVLHHYLGSRDPATCFVKDTPRHG